MTPAQQPTIDPALADEARAAGSPVLPLSPAGASKTAAQPSPMALDHTAPSGVPLAAGQPVPTTQDPTTPPAVLAAAGAKNTTPPAVLAPAGAKDADAYFCTAHLTSDLKRRTVRGGAVTLSAQGVKFALRLGSTAILARLLTPADFGLIAMVTVVTGFVEMFKDAGLSMATVQRERITHAQVSTLFWINVALSALIMCVIAAMAPAIAWFYGDARLLPVTLALSGTMIFGGLAVQHQALLRRKMQFGRLAVIEIASMTAGIAAAVAMAWFGFTYWSLVGMTAATAATTALLSFTLSGWIPGLPVRGSGVMPMLKFGGNVTGFSFVNYLSRNADNFLIGWWWGPVSLGVYSKAYGLLMMPIIQINRPVHSVAMPMLARLQDQPDQFRKAFNKILDVLATITVPSVAALLVISDAVVFVVLGDKWAEAVPVFAALGVSALFQSIYNSTGWILIATGRGKAYFRMSLLIAVPTVCAFVIGLPFGPLGVAIAYSVVNVLFVSPVLFWYVTRKSPVHMSDFYISLYKPLLLGIGVGGVLLLLRQLVPLQDPYLLILSAAILVLPGMLFGLNNYSEFRKRGSRRGTA